MDNWTQISKCIRPGRVPFGKAARDEKSGQGNFGTERSFPVLLLLLEARNRPYVRRGNGEEDEVGEQVLDL